MYIEMNINLSIPFLTVYKMEKIEYTTSKDHEFSMEHFLHPLYLSNADQFIYHTSCNFNDDLMFTFFVITITSQIIEYVEIISCIIFYRKLFF